MLNTAKSEMHDYLKEHCDQISAENVYFRKLTQEDVDEVRKLHEEWFPLNYPDSFYNKVAKNNVIAIGCFTKIISLDPKNKVP